VLRAAFLCFLALCFAVQNAAIHAAQNAAIHMDGGVFRVTGWPAGAEPADGWGTLFAVYAGAGDVPPMLGTWRVEEGSLVFRPRFPLEPGMRVRAVFRPPGAPAVNATFDLPKAAPLVSTTRVAQVYPSTGVLPANQLKLYIYFSAPMRKGESWRHIRLLREDGSQEPYPFLELDQELWDRDQLRFTVLFDPGRIKRGLASLAEAGPALEEGRRYTLVIDRQWLDGRGAPLADEFRKPFRVVGADRNPPNPAKWRVTAPRAGTTDALTIAFPEPMDYALLQHEIEVAGPDRSVTGSLAGSVDVQHEETEWRFTPQQPWIQGEYSIVIHTTLEDLAGNHINRAFDVDTFDPITRKVERETVSLPLRIRR
jgi:hypothetical protein